MSVYTKIKIKLFVFDMAFNLVMWASIIACALLFNKIIEAFFFYICWNIFRSAYPKEYHYKHSAKPIVNILGCLFWSNVIFWVVISNMLPVTTSIFASVVLGSVINFMLYKFQDYLDLKHEIANQTKNIYEMTEDELRTYAKSKHLPEIMIDTLVLKVVHNYRWCEIMAERSYSKTAIRYHRKQINRYLSIEL